MDITDLFVFAEKPGKSILILNAHPSVSFDPRKETTPVPFAADAIYEFKLDTDNDAIADVAYRISFTPFAGGAQTATLRYFEDDQASTIDDGGRVLIKEAPVSLGRDALISEAEGYRFFAGWRSDPFFFDPVGTLNGFRFTGQDFFADKDVCSIALEIPNSVLGSNEVGLWVRTLFRVDCRWIQADRGARPAQSIFLPGEARDAYLAGEPANDMHFIADFAHSLEHTGGYSPAEAVRVAETLLPDILHFDPGRPASYPENGRALTDDVIDRFLAVLTNGKIKTDGIGPHGDLLGEFPYLGRPHADRTDAKPVVAADPDLATTGGSICPVC